MERVWPLIVALIVAGCGAHAAGPGPAGSVSGTTGPFAAQATPASLAAGATLRESMEIANAAASIVIHQLGTTGTATVDQIGMRLLP